MTKLELRNRHRDEHLENLHHPRRFSWICCQSVLPPRDTLLTFQCQVLCLFLHHIAGIFEWIPSVCLLLFKITAARFTHAVVRITNLFFCSSYTVLRIGIFHSLLIQGPVLMITGVVSSLGLVWMKLLWTTTYMSLHMTYESILLNIYLGVEVLGHRTGTYLTWGDTAKEFSKVTELI